MKVLYIKYNALLKIVILSSYNIILCTKTLKKNKEIIRNCIVNFFFQAENNTLVYYIRFIIRIEIF